MATDAMKSKQSLTVLIGAKVNFLRFSYQVDINLLGGENRERKYANLQIEADFELAIGGETYTVRPGDKATLAPLIHLLNATLQEIALTSDDRLTLTFDDAMRLSVAPISKFEAWNLSGDDISYHVATGI